VIFSAIVIGLSCVFPVLEPACGFGAELCHTSDSEGKFNRKSELILGSQFSVPFSFYKTGRMFIAMVQVVGMISGDVW
jgi:hypothetical protein